MPRDRYTPGYSPSLPRAAIAGATANPFEGLLSSIERAGEKVAMDSAARVAEQRVFAGEQPGLTLGLTDVGRVYNRAAQVAYEAQTEQQIRGKLSELSARYPGRQAGDVEGFTREFDDFAGAIAGSVPAEMQARVRAELGTRRQFALGRITEQANAYELQRSNSAIEASINADVMEAAGLARDGADPAALAALYARADGKINERVALGLLAPDEAEIQKAQYRSGIQAEAIFGDAMRSGTADAVVADLAGGGRTAEGLTLEDRDRVIAKITAESNRAHALKSRAEAEQEKDAKTIRGSIRVALTEAMFSGDPNRRPTPEQVVTLNRAGLLDADDADRILRDLATNKVARNDLEVIGRLEDEMASGVDIATAIDDAAADGLIATDTAMELKQKNREKVDRVLPEPIRETRDQVTELYKSGGPLAKYEEGEQERKISALRFFDEQVRAAADGVDPDTGLTFKELAAEKAFQILAQRKRGKDISGLLAIPPQGFVPVQTPGEPTKLSIPDTMSTLLLKRQEGLITDDELKAELRLIEQWEKLGLTVQ